MKYTLAVIIGYAVGDYLGAEVVTSLLVAGASLWLLSEYITHRKEESAKG